MWKICVRLRERDAYKSATFHKDSHRRTNWRWAPDAQEDRAEITVMLTGGYYTQERKKTVPRT